MWLLQRFCNRLRLRYLLHRYVRTFQRRAEYDPAELFLALLSAIIRGLRRINKAEILPYNGAFLEMLGLRRFPDQPTLRRFLKRLPPATTRRLVRLHDSLRAYLFTVPETRTTLVFDLDSVVVVIYGREEGARVGYNPKKHGRRSSHPLLCFEAHFQEFWHGRLRPGNAATATGAVPFLRACLAQVPPGIARRRIRFRMDAGFYGSRASRFLDESRCGYVLVVPESPHLSARAQGCRLHRVANGWEAGVFRAPVHHKGKRPHRFVVIRRPLPTEPTEAEQRTFFTDRRYGYHLFVTDLRLSPWRPYLPDRPRAAVEKNTRELLYDYPPGKIPTASWTADVAFFQLLLLAAALVHWFKRLC